MDFTELIKKMKELNPSEKVLLSFSRGKDAWGVWAAIKDHFDVIPFHYYCSCPHMSFIDEYLEYAEKKMGTHIYNLPAPCVYNNLSAVGCAMQPPQRVLCLDALDLKPFTFEDLQNQVIAEAGLPKDTYTALGVRACDSARRALFFKTHGPISQGRKKFYPIWDWNKDRLIDELKRHDIKLPREYKLFGRSFDGIYVTYLLPIKKYYPEDYKRILEYYPLIDMEIYRYEKRQALGF